jgi:hypothetical protein
MKRFLHITLVLLLTMVIAFSNSFAVLADGEDGEHGLEMEVNGIHVSLANQNEWKKGENTIVVTLKDSSGLPVNHANVELLIGPKAEEHAAEHSPEAPDPNIASAHGAEQGHSSMPGMEMDEPATETHQMPAHNEEKEPLPSEELGEDGIYMVETHLESSGTHEINVMFHVNGEMLQANFVVDIPSVISKSAVLWSFVAINVVLITSAGVLKKQSIPVKGRQ